MLNQLMGLSVDSVGVSAVASAIRARMKKCGIQSDDDYAALVRVSSVEMQELVEEVIVPETWFFRDQKPFAALGQWAMKEWLPAHAHNVLRLLSVPCASGEEPFSMTMALLDAGVPPDRFVVEAVDISAATLARARKGLYGRNSFRNPDIAFRDTYFRPVKDGWLLGEDVRRLVQFRQANLLDPAFDSGANDKDVIFCRNVLIYFDEPAQRRVMDALDRMLSPDGLLFVGHAEAYVFRSSGFVPAQMPMAFAFRKRGTRAPVQITRRRRTKTPTQVPFPAIPVPAKLPPLPVIRQNPKTPAPPAAAVSAPPSPTEAVLAEAQQLADAGRFGDALEKCSNCLKTHGPSSRVFLLLGLLHDAAGKVVEAADFYRKAVYLDPNHYEAMAHLALLAQKTGDLNAARQLRDRSRRVQAKLTAPEHQPA